MVSLQAICAAAFASAYLVAWLLLPWPLVGAQGRVAERGADLAAIVRPGDSRFDEPPPYLSDEP